METSTRSFSLSARVYAAAPDGEGPTARYDIDIVSVEEGSARSAQEGIITSLGGRRAAFRLLFAASFVPYFLPDSIKPDFFKDDFGKRPPLESDPLASQPNVDRSDVYVARQLDALFTNQDLPKASPK